MQEVKTVLSSQGRKNKYKSRYHPIYQAYENYIKGDLGALESLDPESKSLLEKAIKVSTSGKTAYQAAQETGISSDIFYLLRIVRKNVRHGRQGKLRSQSK